MSNVNHVQLLRQLCADYYNRNLSVVEYRVRRKWVIDQMDLHHNGSASGVGGSDTTQPQRREPTE
jgi:hypothetical protein